MNIDKAAYEEIIPRLSLRAQKMLRWLLEHGSISTYDIEKLEYGHPPRVAQDLKDAGIIIKRIWGQHPETGNRMGIYVLGAEAPITKNTFSGRKALSRNLENQIYEHYGIRCNMDAFEHGKRALQADHRIPYLVGGDPDRFDVSDWQLLCGSHQQRKKHECENCDNMKIKEVEICNGCFWAFPENYSHVAMKPLRRIDTSWGQEDMDTFNRLKGFPEEKGIDLTEAIRRIVRKYFEE